MPASSTGTLHAATTPCFRAFFEQGIPANTCAPAIQPLWPPGEMSAFGQGLWGIPWDIPGPVGGSLSPARSCLCPFLLLHSRGQEVTTHRPGAGAASSPSPWPCSSKPDLGLMKTTAEKQISSLVLLYHSEHRASWGLMSTSGFFLPDLPVCRESCQRIICKTLVKLHTWQWARPGIHVLNTLSPCKERQQRDHSPHPKPYSRCDFQH